MAGERGEYTFLTKAGKTKKPSADESKTRLARDFLLLASNYPHHHDTAKSSFAVVVYEYIQEKYQQPAFSHQKTHPLQYTVSFVSIFECAHNCTAKVTPIMIECRS